MKRIFLSFLLLAGASLLHTAKAQCSTIAGEWNGALQVQGIKLRLVFHFFCKGDTVTATFDSPDQGAKGIPFDKVTLKGNEITIDAPSLMASYKASLKADTLLEGTWTQGGMSLPLNLSKASSPFTLNRPQEPKPPLPYKSNEVQFNSANKEVMLAGTLTMPEGSGPFSAVVLISGSGPQNRDEELLSHKPFLVLSDYLTRLGFAVLRYDDRGVGKSTGDFSKATLLDFADDAEGAFEYLLSRPEIAKKKIGLAGHSEGGMIAPVVASRNHQVAFIVLLAGPGQRSTDLMADQARLVSLAAGESEASVNEAVALNQKLFAILMQQPNDSLAALEMKNLVTAEVGAAKTLTDAEKKEHIEQLPITLRKILNPWFRTFIAWDPSPWLEKVKCPVLAINGTTDLQVPSAKNLPLVDAALRRGGNQRVKVVELNGLNHLFQHSATGNPMEYGTIEETFAPEALEAIGGWMKEVAASR